MVGKKDANKPKGRMSAYAYFIQICREEHKKKHPGESVGFADFSKKCSLKWRDMGTKDKKRFDDLSGKDKIRYDKEMATYVPTGEVKGAAKRKKKDPNAPKRPLSAFFFFSNEERPKVKAVNPSWTVGDIAKALGKKWEVCPNRPKFDALAVKAKAQYEKDLAAYKKNGGGAEGAAKGESSPKKSKKVVAAVVAEPESEEEEESEDEDDEEEEDDE